MTTTVRQEFGIEGMHCAGCVKSVTRAVSQVPGVRQVDVSLEKKGATVEYDGEMSTSAAIVAAIEAAGIEGRVR